MMPIVFCQPPVLRSWFGVARSIDTFGSWHRPRGARSPEDTPLTVGLATRSPPGCRQNTRRGRKSGFHVRRRRARAEEITVASKSLPEVHSWLHLDLATIADELLRRNLILTRRCARCSDRRDVDAGAEAIHRRDFRAPSSTDMASENLSLGAQSWRNRRIAFTSIRNS